MPQDSAPPRRQHLRTARPGIHLAATAILATAILITWFLGLWPGIVTGLRVLLT